MFRGTESQNIPFLVSHLYGSHALSTHVAFEVWSSTPNWMEDAPKSHSRRIKVVSMHQTELHFLRATAGSWETWLVMRPGCMASGETDACKLNCPPLMRRN
ncbi:hypothetical protein RSAG8_09335, partial [Rhizoctonia solani AG-8 WAC10335]